MMTSNAGVEFVLCPDTTGSITTAMAGHHQDGDQSRRGVIPEQRTDAAKAKKSRQGRTV
jgi:hypothetical protein